MADDRIETLARALWRQDHGPRTVPVDDEAWEVYRMRAEARLKREETDG